MPVVRELPAHFLSPDATPISSIPLSPIHSHFRSPLCSLPTTHPTVRATHTAGECDCVSLRRPSCSLPRQSLDGRMDGRRGGRTEATSWPDRSHFLS